MTKLFSLFGTQKELTEAIDALVQEFDDVETKVIESEEEAKESGPKFAAPTSYPGTGGAPVVGTAQSKIAELAMSDEEAQFYTRGVKKGGKLLIVEMDEDEADDVRRLLREQNGRTPKQVSS